MPNCVTLHPSIVISWKSHGENPDELQVENVESADGPTRMENPIAPYARGLLGQWVIEKVYVTILGH